MKVINLSQLRSNEAHQDPLRRFAFFPKFHYDQYSYVIPEKKKEAISLNMKIKKFISPIVLYVGTVELISSGLEPKCQKAIWAVYPSKAKTELIYLTR